MPLSAVILSFNRRDALRHSLTQAFSQPWAIDSQIIVVDNASTDGSAAMVKEHFPSVELIALDENVILQGFNIGARLARHDLLLILDDDAWPHENSIPAAAAFLAKNPHVGGIMLHRQHPRTRGFEWPFAAASLEGVQHNWPDMGCGNLIRTAVWEKVGGYETGYTLYRNDTDLALKIIGSGYDVVFCRDWLVWHDSAIVTVKTNKWLRLSTRNWMWLAKRHAAGTTRLRGQLLGWLHAHRLAGLRPTGHWNVLKGALAGLATPAPPLPPCVRPSNTAYQRLLRLKMTHRA